MWIDGCGLPGGCFLGVVCFCLCSCCPVCVWFWVVLLLTCLLVGLGFEGDLLLGCVGGLGWWLLVWCVLVDLPVCLSFGDLFFWDSCLGDALLQACILDACLRVSCSCGAPCGCFLRFGLAADVWQAMRPLTR